jgi:hypothetical protein
MTSTQVATALGRRQGVAVSLGLVPVSSVASIDFPYIFLFILGLLCKRVPSSLFIGSAVVALFIKQGESLF